MSVNKISSSSSAALRHYRKKQGGFTNIQISIGILVGVIMVLGALAGFQYVAQAKVANEQSALADLRSATVRYGQFSGPFTSSNMTISILDGLNFFPEYSKTGSGSSVVVFNQWGGIITPTIGTIKNAGDSIVFAFAGVPTLACRELGVKLDSTANVITINGTVTKAAGVKTTPSAVVTACAEGDDNLMSYTISR